MWGKKGKKKGGGRGKKRAVKSQKSGKPLLPGPECPKIAPGGTDVDLVIKKVAAGPFLITSLLTRFFYKPSGFHSVRAFSFFEAFTAPPDPLRPPTAPPTAPKLLRTTSNHIASPHLDLRTTPKPPQHHPKTTYLPHPIFTHTHGASWSRTNVAG